MKNLSKAALRQHFKGVRSHITLPERQHAAHLATQFFVADKLFQDSQAIACYLPFMSEFDTRDIIEKIWQAHKHCYLPVLTENKILHFVRFVQNTVLRKNKFGILEPKDTNHLYSARELDVVITPLIAYDDKGHRLGTGGGYYDHTFAFLKQESLHKPVLLGLGFAAQAAEEIPFEPWDVKLDGILTENGLEIFIL
jgi:5-formyltetrahydrofolate cyclo-ligase